MLQNHTEPAKLITLLELFDGRKFEVPDYQRGYSWDEEQVLDLLSDIEMHNSKSGHKHFTGTIVVERPNGGNTYQIVDGQQRLVTCVIILRAIVELNPRKLKGLESILTKTRSGFETAITLGEQDDRYFNRSVLNVSRVRIKTASNRRLKEAYAQIMDWVKKNKTNLNALFNTLISGLGFIFFETVSEKETTAMFEVINNRGKGLSELEKFKNYFLHLCHIHGYKELEEDINSKWVEILSNLEKAGYTSIQKENHFVRTAFSVIFWKVKKDSKDIYREFREYIHVRSSENAGYLLKSNNPTKQDDNLITDISQYFNFLNSSALAYAYLFNRDGYFRDHGREMFSEKLDQIFKKFRNHGSTGNIMPVFLVLMKHFFENPNCRTSIADVIDVVEKLNFRCYCLPKVFYRADTRSSELLKLAFDIYSGNEFNEEGEPIDSNNPDMISAPDYYLRIKRYLINFIDIHCPESKFVEALTPDKHETHDFYSWSSLKFFLALYENKLRPKTNNTWDYETLLAEGDAKNSMTKEHILAVDNDELFTKKGSKEKRRLGNFMLVSQALNNKLGTHNVKKKMEIIRDNVADPVRLQHVHEAVDLFFRVYDGPTGQGKKTKNRQEQIIESVFDLRETNMIKFALKEWAYPGEPKFKFEKVDTAQSIRDRRNARYYPDYEKFL